MRAAEDNVIQQRPHFFGKSQGPGWENPTGKKEIIVLIQISKKTSKEPSSQDNFIWHKTGWSLESQILLWRFCEES